MGKHFLNYPMITPTINRGRSRIFIGGGGGIKDYVRYGQVQGPLKGRGSSQVFFYAVSCYLSLIFKNSDTKWGGGEPSP